MNTAPVQMVTDDNGRLWAREIQNCNPALMPREVTQNGKEAGAGISDIEVLWLSLLIDGTTKLACYNNAPGMTEEELRNFCHKMSWSGSLKNMGSSGNFGVGARLAGLGSNPFGMEIYTQVENGSIYKGTIGLDSEGRPACLVDVARVQTSPYFLNGRGTLIIFLGKERSHNTVLQPWRGAKQKKAQLQESLLKRYWRLPPGMQVKFDPSISSGNNPRLVTLESFMQQNALVRETVNVSDDMKIHYAHMESKTRGRIQVGNSQIDGFGGVVFQDEFYDLSYGIEWSGEAIHFGVEDLSNEIWIAVELTNAYGKFQPEMSRERLIWDADYVEKVQKNSSDGKFRPFYTSNRRHVSIRNFTHEVFINMPEWLKKLVERKRAESDEEQSRMDDKAFQDMLKEFKAYQRGIRPDLYGNAFGGDSDAFSSANSGGQKGSSLRGVVLEKGSKTKGRDVLSLEKRPEVLIVQDSTQPVVFSKDQGTQRMKMILDEKHPVIQRTKTDMRKLLKQMPELEFEETWKSIAQSVGSVTFTRHYIAALSLRFHSHDWDDEQFDAALLPPQAILALGYSHEFHESCMKRAKDNVKRLKLSFIEVAA